MDPHDVDVYYVKYNVKDDINDDARDDNVATDSGIDWKDITGTYNDDYDADDDKCCCHSIDDE